MADAPKTVRWPNNTLQGYLLAENGDGLVMERPYAARGTVQKQSSPTLTTGNGGGSGVVVNMNEELRIRYLTPRECFRLMGQDEESINRIMEAEPSKTAQYRLAGNSIVVDVLVAIFKGIYVEESFQKAKPKQNSLEDFL